MSMTDEEIADLVTGYANGFDRAISETGLSEVELRDRLLNLSIEECPDCGWFVESSEMFDDEGDVDGHCCNCREQD